MFCCSNSNSLPSLSVSTVEKKIQSSGIKARDARITSIVLAMLTLFLFAASYVLYGVGTISPTALMGLGMFPYLGGVLFSFIGLGLLCGSFIFTVIYGVKTYQKESWKKVLGRA